jgi:predicted outer membrane repeat protein
VLDGFTITGGYVENGAGIVCSRSSPTIARCVITGNSADSSDQYALPTGGGIGLYESTATIDCCIIAYNSATAFGGGVYSTRGGPTVSNCIITGNSAHDGAGLYCYSESLMITNCTVTNNSASCGGGFYSYLRGSATISHSILWANKASGGGPEVCVGMFSEVTVSYSDVKGGRAAVKLDSPYDSTLNWGGGNIDSDPLFEEPGSGNYHLSVFSPCIEAGDPASHPAAGATDIDSDPRIIGDRVDMGADEFAFRTPFIGVSSPHIVFNAHVNGPNPEAQLLSIRNIGMGVIRWVITQDYPWLRVTPTSGESSGNIVEVVLSPDIAQLERGLHDCGLAIVSQEAANSRKKILVQLYNNAELLVPAQYASIQAAINAAIDGDTVVLSEGIYKGEGNRDIDFLGKAITIRSTNPSDPRVVASTVIDCDGRGRGFIFRSGEKSLSVLSGVTITKGLGPRQTFGPGTARSCGGAIYCYNSSPIISHCRIVGNQADHHGGVSGVGGAIACQANSNPTFDDCVISDNFADENGGGIASRFNSSPALSYCTITDNQAGEEGGGIHSTDGDPKLSHCIITNNVAGTDGGGIYCQSGSPTITHCRIANNRASQNGGGINSYYCWLTITNCMVAANSADQDGGGIYSYLTDHEVLNTTIAGNLAHDKGGGICFPSASDTWIRNCTLTNNSAAYGGAVCCYYIGDHTLTNCILWSDSAVYGPEIAICGANSHLTVSYNNIQGSCALVYTESSIPANSLNWGQGNIDADPCFADPNNGDYHLKSQAGRWDANSQSWVKDDVTSPCIDAGDPMSPIGHEPFPNAGMINMGAYGGTAEASKSYFDKPICEVIIAGDINGDCIIDFKDFTLMALHWLECIGQNQDGWRLIEDDMEDSYSCEGNFDIFYPCSNAADEDWDTYALPADPGATSYIYENYVIPSGIAMADFRIKYQQTASVTPGLCTTVTDYWDGNAWTALNCTALSNQISTLTVRTPHDALNRTTLQLRTRVWKSMGLPGSGSGMYYEGKVIWYFWPVCETIVAGDINGNCSVDFADFTIMALHWLEDKNQ